MGNAQCRKWQVTINKPEEHNMSREMIVRAVEALMPDYFCMADEIASTGTKHTHIYIYRKAPIRFNTIKQKLPIAHIEKAYGSSRENKEYITKTGKWKESLKSETRIEGSFYEFGEIPTEKEETNSKNEELIELIKSGKAAAEIILEEPKYALQARNIEYLIETMKEKRGSAIRPEMQVFYLFGATGTGKTRSIYERHKPEDICRITSYRNGQVLFDSYHGEDVLVFEEFTGQIPISEMLNYLDIYPIRLPARYSDRIALYTKVYITSNLSLNELYEEIQRKHPEVWRAFKRRITKVYYYEKAGEEPQEVVFWE